MRRVLALVMMFGGVAAADSPGPIAVKSVTGAPDAEKPIQLVTGDLQYWCQAKAPVGPGQPLTITLAAPAAVGSVEIKLDNGANTVGSAEVTADGKVFTAPSNDKHSSAKVKLSGAPVTTLVVRLVVTKQEASRDNTTCSDGVALVGAAENTPVIEVADAAAAAAFWPDVTALHDAFAKCDKAALAAAVVFPLTTGWYDEDINGMKDLSKKYKSAAALATACKKKKVRAAAYDLTSLIVKSESATKLDVSGEGTMWSFEYAGGHWKLRSTHEGG